MELNATLWDKAELEFQNRTSNKPVNTNEFAEIILATFVFSRKKLREEIHKLSRLGDDKLAKYGLVSEPDFLSYDATRGICFSIEEDKRPFEVQEKERKERNQSRNYKIIKGIIEKDRKVYLNLYEEEFPKIVRMITKNNGTIDNARDVFQDGLIILIENLLYKKLEITESFDGYLYSVCRNLWYKQIILQKKKLRFYDEYLYDELEITFNEIELQQDKYEQYASVIETLGESCRKLLECYYYQKKGWSEIANELGYASTGSARNQKYKCLERIRKQLTEVEEN